MKLTPIIGTTAIVASIVAGCLNPHGAYREAVQSWKSGDRDRCIAMARVQYERFRDDNDLDETIVRSTADRAMQQLSDELVVPKGLVSRSPEGVDPVREGPDLVSQLIQKDLLSGSATAIMRATQSVAALGLIEHAPGLIAVVFRLEAVRADGGVLEGVSAALRSVATKRAALDALRRLNKP